LYDYKKKNPGCILQTEYNLAEQENEDSNDDDEKWIFCSDLDKIEIALPKGDGGDFCSMKVPPRHKQKLLQRR
jgi:hypothetical protein